MAEQDVMQEEMMKVGQPGKEHEMLAKHAGNWDVTMKASMNPDEPPAEIKGTSTAKMILGGRVLVEDFKAEMMGKPFEGHGMMGYGNFRNRWWHTWTDSWSTGLYYGEGTGTPDGRTLTLIGKSDRPMMNKKDVEMKGVYRFINDNEYIFETYDKGPDGKDVKTMELHYRRK